MWLYLSLAQDWQYQCLLRLKGAKLQEFLSHVNALRASWGRKAIKECEEQGGELVDVPDFEPNEGDEPENNPDEAPEVAASLLPTVLDRVLIEWTRVRVLCNMLEIKVIFDHCSSGSGDRQRGYCNCPRHANCFRWKPCSAFNCRDDFAAYMFAWAAGGMDLADRNRHMEFYEPPEDEIQVVKASMELEEW